MDLELSPGVTLKYMILQPEKEFQRIHRQTRQNGTCQSGLSEKFRILHGKVFATGDKRCPVAIFKELMWRCPPKIVGTLSKDHDDGSENVGKKNEFAFFQTWSRLFGPAQYLKGRRLFLGWILMDFIQVQKDEGKFVVVCPRPPLNVEIGGFTS